jgi:hypothetical protein
MGKIQASFSQSSAANIHDPVPGMAEGVGFEPTSRFRETVFKTAALDRSAIPPQEYGIIIITTHMGQYIFAFCQMGAGLSVENRFAGRPPSGAQSSTKTTEMFVDRSSVLWSIKKFAKHGLCRQICLVFTYLR